MGSKPAGVGGKEPCTKLRERLTWGLPRVRTATDTGSGEAAEVESSREDVGSCPQRGDAGPGSAWLGFPEGLPQVNPSQPSFKEVECDPQRGLAGGVQGTWLTSPSPPAPAVCTQGYWQSGAATPTQQGQVFPGPGELGIAKLVQGGFTKGQVPNAALWGGPGWLEYHLFF